MAFITPAFGIIGNILSIIIFTKTRLRNHPTSLYMTAIASLDLLMVLSLTSMIEIPRSIAGIVPSNDIHCRLYPFAVRANAEASNWVLACMSVERCLAIANPLKAKLYLSKSRNIALIFGSIIMMYAYQFYNLVLNVSDGSKCVFKFTKIFSPWVRFGMDYGFCIIAPGLIIFFANAIIIKSMFNAKSDSLRANKTSKSDSVAKSLLAMMVSVSVAYIILKTPYHLYIVLVPHEPMAYMVSSHSLALSRLGIALLAWMQYLNNCINFYLYVLTGREFRSELVNYYKKCCKKSVAKSSTGVTSEGSIHVI